MAEKKTRAVVAALTLPIIKKVCMHIYGLPKKGPARIKKINPKHLGCDVTFDDAHLENPTCVSDAPNLCDDWKYAGLFELMAYLATDRGQKRTIHHQVVARKATTIGGKKYYFAVGRISSENVLYFLPAAGKAVWPKTAVFLKFKPTVSKT